MAATQPENRTSAIWQSMKGGGGQQVYALVDAARDAGIYNRLAEAENDIRPLFTGGRASELALVGPYLVRLEANDPLAKWLADEGWAKSWGLYCNSSETIEKLQRHFYSMLQVVDEEGTPLIFRFYDPRVFRVYLPTCSGEELQEIFGPVSRFYVEDGEDGTGIEFSLSKGKLVQKRM